MSNHGISTIYYEFCRVCYRFSLSSLDKTLPNSPRLWSISWKELGRVSLQNLLLLRGAASLNSSFDSYQLSTGEMPCFYSFICVTHCVNAVYACSNNGHCGSHLLGRLPALSDILLVVNDLEVTKLKNSIYINCER